jgi:predicted outer membrane repeat protein
VTLTTRTSALLAAALLGLAFANTAGAATVKVNCATQNLQNKINAAPAGSTILIKGTCVGNFVVAKRLTLKGNPTATLDGNHAGTVVYITAARPVRLVHLRIVNGQSLQGGGVTTFGSVTLDHVVVRGNTAQTSGGGILAAEKVTLLSSTVVHNTVEWNANGASVKGGGINAASVRLDRSVVRDNLAHATSIPNSPIASGGGIAVSKGVVATRSHIDRNTVRADGITATASGGGIAQLDAGATVRLTRSTLNRNAVITTALNGFGTSQGGAVQAFKVAATRSDFVGNSLNAFSEFQSAQVRGGAIYAVESSTLTRVRIRNSRLDTNSGGTTVVEGGGIALEDPTAKLTIAGSTISGNVTNVLSSNAATADGGAVRPQRAPSRPAGRSGPTRRSRFRARP